MLLSHMNLMKKLKTNIQDSINMKVQFDLRNVKDLSNISQAIKVLATTLKNIDFDVLVMEKLSNTFSDTNNLKVIYNPLKECDYLITLSHDALKLDNLISLKLLKAKDNVIYLANLNNTNIIGDLIADLCANSSVDEGLKFSNTTFEKINRLKQFNYKYI